MKLARSILLPLAALAALTSGGCSLPLWKGFGWGAGDSGMANNRSAELGSGLREPSKSSGKDMLGLDPRAREIEKNLGL